MRARPEIGARRRLGAGLALLLLLAAQEGAAQPAPCVIVHGNGRNLGDAQENEAWDRVNAQFNAQVVERLAEAGLRALPMRVPVGSIAPQLAVARLLEAAQREGCRRVIDTAVFADEAAAALVVRLRVHPVLASLGPRQAAAEPQIGEALYTSQRDFALGNARALERPRLEALAREMVEAYLETLSRSDR